MRISDWSSDVCSSDLRTTFDLGQPLSEAATVRLTGLYQDSGSYRDGVDYNRWGFNPTTSFRIGEDTLIQAGYEHFKDSRVADRGIPSFDGKPVETSRRSAERRVGKEGGRTGKT